MMAWKGLKFDTNNVEVYPPKPATLFFASKSVGLIKKNAEVLEIGTGSGAVAIAVAKFVKNSKVTATDINPESIAVAASNAKLNQVEIRTLLGDLFQPFSNERFDVIMAHPPAVPYPNGKTWGLTQGMTVATNGGIDGSALIVRTISETPKYLKKHGKLLLLLPHWSNTGEAYKTLLHNYSEVRKIAHKKVKFFPASEGKATKGLLQHVSKLSEEGLIELHEKNGSFYSVVSIIEAIK